MVDTLEWLEDFDEEVPSAEDVERLIAAAEAEFDPYGEGQPPTLSELEEARAEARLAERRTVEWMMVSAADEEEPDVEALLAELVSRPEWHSRANCRGADPTMFVPPLYVRRFTRLALAYCADCSVKGECLASALEAPWTVGVWGGTTEVQRRLRRRGVVA